MRISLCAAFVMLNGCMLLDLQEDVQWLDEATVISGNIDFPAGTSAAVRTQPLVIGLVRRKSDGDYEIDTYTVQYGAGKFSLLRRRGEFYLMAFADANEDLTFQHDEYVGWYGNPTPIRAIRGGKDLVGMDIELRAPDRARRELPVIYTPNLSEVSAVRDTIHVGEVTDINDTRFTQEIGTMGLWEPVKFVRGGNSGIFFLDAYDAEKIPILFVHGITGTAQAWRPMVDALDRERYQPWLLQYPSGMRLGLLSRMVNQALTELQVKYNANTVYVVAHSMGGLLARGVINESRAQNPHSPIEKFVSISTPWGGHKAAEMGIDRAPVAVPVWYDMAPNSPYIANLFNRPLPDELPFYLLFTHKGSRGFMTGGNSDGTVSIASQLELPAQMAAQLQIGFDDNHSKILGSPLLHETVNALLDGTHCKLTTTSGRTFTSGPCR